MRMRMRKRGNRGRRETNRAMERAKDQCRNNPGASQSRVDLSLSLLLSLEYSVSSPRHLVPHFILDLELLFLYSTVLPPSPPYPRYSTLRLDRNRSYHSQLTNVCRPRIPPQYVSATVTPGVRGQVRPACNWTLTPNIRQSRARPRWHCVDGAWSSEAVGQWALWLAARGPA
jgi:hypothetical protein